MRDIETLHQPIAQNPRLLAQPVRVVVPSRSLREHVGSVLVRHFGRSLAGISLHTLHGLAVEIVDRATVQPLDASALFPIIVRQQARREASLRAELDTLADGYAAVVGTVADLLDAGLTPWHGEALDELLGQEEAPAAKVRRARALLRVAARTAETMESANLGRPSTLFRVATGVLEQYAESALPARAVLIHGFADATGVALDFIEALARYRAASIYLDHPLDPTASGGRAAGAEFTRRFAERLAAVALLSRQPASAAPPPHITLLRAPGGHAEVRAVARRIGALLERGQSPERIGVVARDIAPYAIPLRLHMRQLGIPFSGIAAKGPAGAAARRVHALLELLRDRREALTDRWLDALGPPGGNCDTAGPDRTRLVDLRLATRALAAVRLAELAALDADSVLPVAGNYPLPSRRGLWVAEGDGVDESTPRATRRQLPGTVLRQALAAARALCARLAGWPSQASLGAHLHELDCLLRKDLNWDADRAQFDEIIARLDSLSTSTGTADLDYDDFVLLLEHVLGEFGRVPLGGAGGGVQVLDVTEARGRTFEQLFVLGMNRDVFPRMVLEDPLLPDSLRRAIGTLLPDIPIKQYGFDEERYLFAQLLSASPRVTFSWQSNDDDGKARPPSPLVERLHLARPEIEVHTVSSLRSHPQASGSARGHAAEEMLPPFLRPAHEHALLAGLHGCRDDVDRLMPLAIAESYCGLGTVEPPIAPAETARARLAVLAELDPDGRTSAGLARRRQLGPYFGFVGPVREPADPRRADLFITTVENAARCPWQVFLQRILHVAPTPDPLEALPSIDPVLLGSAVHRVLERIVRDAVPYPRTSLADARTRRPVPVRWPDDVRLEQLLREETIALVRDEGIALPGIANALARQARPYIEEARRLDWPEPDSTVDVLAAECTGTISVGDSGDHLRKISFRADRLDAAAGGLRLTDYKTGKPMDQTGPEKRREHFLRRVAAGELLQAAAYALGAGGARDQGRYLFIGPELAPETRALAVQHGDQEMTAAFYQTVLAVLSSWELGSLFPRVEEPGGKACSACRTCEVAQACLANDSGYRTRLARWSREKRAVGAHGGLTPDERALLSVWSLRENLP